MPQCSLHQIEAFADAGQHAERQHIDFHQPRTSMSSLSHSMKVRSCIAALPMGTMRVEPVAGQHEAADMLRKMARKAQHLTGQIQHRG
jgi:hypothetical protein